MTPLLSVLRTLHSREEPIFAVLDGAQFDDLPGALFDGDFVARPLYLDRGDNNPEQVITAPQMVWLDESAEQEGGRSFPETLEALSRLVEERPAAVFWHCAAGGDALYRHLRTINMVRLPRSALAEEAQAEINADHVAALFRHSDANVLAQVFAGVDLREGARLLGPAQRLLFAPEAHWSPEFGHITVERSADWPEPGRGTLTLSEATMRRIEEVREAGMRTWAKTHFTTDPQEGFDPSCAAQVQRAYTRAQGYGLEEKEDIWEFIRLDLSFGENFEHQPRFSRAHDALTEVETPASARIEYASDICRAIL
jgi:hypothetical protein